jgi:site-specific recombinase XerD
MFTSTFAAGPRPWALDPGVLRPLIDSYVADLASRGYEAATIHHLEHSARHFCYWLNHSGIAVSQTDDQVIKRFTEHRCHCPGYRAAEILSAAFAGMVQKFIGFLEESQFVHRAAPSICDGRVQAYLDWLREHRGLSEQTIAARRKLMKQILPLLGADPGSYDAAGVRGVILSESQRRSAVNMKSIVTVLRSYLNYLATQGQCSSSLVQAVPTVAHWKHSNLPKYLSAAKVEALINSCDTAPNGIRDRAILLLLARLGLRAGDIMRLCIGDIDWQQGSLRVCGKGRREAKLPLPQDVGDAVLKYLNEVRPKVPIARIFLRSLAPCQPFVESSTGISTIVRRALVRAGIHDAPSQGAHMLRHSAATTWLRSGTPLVAIGAVLRHRSIDTTAQYAKVDVPSLKQVAQPWPGGASC